MKNKIYRMLLAAIMAVAAMPTMAQDFMNVYFKDGTFRIFHFSTIQYITTSKADAEGIEHNDYQYQHIKTLDDEYVYDIADIDSITFTKYNEEVVENNTKEALSIVLPALSECQSAKDAESELEAIKQSDGVETAWIEGDFVFIKIVDGEIISFHFPQEDVIHSDGTREQYPKSQQYIKFSPRRINNEDGVQLKAVVANQQHFVDTKDRKDQRNDYMYPLVEKLIKAGYDAIYDSIPDLDFFYDKIYNYDVVFLSTHGGYWENNGGHGLLTGETFGKVEVGKKNSTDPTKAEKAVFKKEFDKLFDNPKYMFQEDNMTLLYEKEWREEDGVGKYYWVSYVWIKESFFKGTLGRKFNNSKSLFFNAACQSLMSNYDLANILREQRGLGTYIGYTQSNVFGQEAGCTMLMEMLDGVSGEKAYAELDSYPVFGQTRPDDKGNYQSITGTYKDEISETLDKNNKHVSQFTASVVMLPKERPQELNMKRYIIPVYTSEMSQDEVLNQYSLNKKVVLLATTTTLDPSKLQLGFKYGTNITQLNQDLQAETQFETYDNGKGNYCFASAITDLVPGQIYYYCGYTHDGLNFNYGNIEQFTVYDAPVLSETSITLQLDNTGNIQISAGSGYYEATSSNPEVATATVNKLKEGNAILLIQTLKAGSTTITVTDTQSGLTATIEVTVKDKPADLQLATTEITLEEGTTGTVEITSGNGTYAAMSSNDNIATATFSGNIITVHAHMQGVAYITIVDETTSQPIELTVTVTAKTTPLVVVPAEAIDLGLPSGTLWASYNVGATKPEEYGGYFAWGETEEKNTTYYWNNYIHCDGIKETYHDIGTDIAGTEFDVARQKWGGTWQIPNIDQLIELKDNCSWTWTTLNGISCAKVTGQNGNYIYIPASNCKGAAGLDGINLWSSTLDSKKPYYAIYLHYHNSWFNWIGGDRCLGFSVRPVISNTPETYDNLVLERKDPICIKTRQNASVNIISGSGYYNATSSDTDVVTADISDWTSMTTQEKGKCVEIQAISVGTATVTVTDTKTGQTETIEVTVTQNVDVLKLSTYTMSLKVGESKDVVITACSGEDYLVQTGDASIATFTLDKDTKTITVTGVGVGTCIVSVYDSGTGETAEVEVTVTQVTQESTETKQTFTVNGVTFTMIKVDGGTFMMGSDDGDSNGKPVHQVTLSDYSIGETEVTQALWVAVMGNNPSEFKTSLQLPVESVEWADCQEFITKLNDLTGQTFRLPTEAEWEFAARGGNYSNGYKYSGSNNVDEVAWHEKNSTSTHEVAQKIPNEIGLYDMSGNVSEWCQDWKGDYSSSPLTNPTGLAEGTFRIERGGGWGYYPYAICCTTTYRGYSYPFAYNSALGLRLAQ